MSTMHVLTHDDLDTDCCSHKLAFEILSTCHEHILERLTTLEAVGRDLVDSTEITEVHLAQLGDILAFLDTAIPIHSADEEQSLFPRLRDRPPFVGVEGTPMDCMEAEHVNHGQLKARLKVAIVKRNAAAAGRYALEMAGEYRAHIQKEEEILFPMAREIITDAATIDAMTREMRARRREVGLLNC